MTGTFPLKTLLVEKNVMVEFGESYNSVRSLQYVQFSALLQLQNTNIIEP
jgi:hypothetical protein